MSATWTLERGVALVRTIEAETVKAGWHAALAGGTLHKGESDHDLDVIVFPHKRKSSQRPNMRGLYSALHRAGLSRWMTRKQLVANWAKRGITDNKWVEIWVAHPGRVDILVLS